MKKRPLRGGGGPSVIRGAMEAMAASTYDMSDLGVDGSCGSWHFFYFYIF